MSSFGQRLIPPQTRYSMKSGTFEIYIEFDNFNRFFLINGTLSTSRSFILAKNCRKHSRMYTFVVLRYQTNLKILKIAEFQCKWLSKPNLELQYQIF